MLNFNEEELYEGYNVMIDVDGSGNWQNCCVFQTKREANDQIDSYNEDDLRDGVYFNYKIVKL